MYKPHRRLRIGQCRKYNTMQNIQRALTPIILRTVSCVS